MSEDKENKFPFSYPTINAARRRQMNRCALCGKPLLTPKQIQAIDDEEELPPLHFTSHAHHVLPRQCGDPSKPEHSWLANVDNCVVIHSDEHIRSAHGGNYNTGGVAPPTAFTYSHDIQHAKHQDWAQRMTAKMKPIWDALAERYEEEQAHLGRS